MKRALLILLAVLLIPLLLALSAAAWLLRTDGGARYALAQAGIYTDGALQVESQSGALFGPLDLRGLRFENAAVKVEIRELHLDWLPGALLTRWLRIGELSLKGVSVTLKPTPPSDEPAGLPPTRLPLNFALRRVLVEDFALYLTPDAEPIRVPRAELLGSWSGDLIEIERVLVSYPGVGDIQLAAEAKLEKEGVELLKFELSGPASVHAQGHIGYTEASDLDLSWQNLRWPLQGEPQVSSAQGKATLKGRPDDLQFKAELALGATAQVQAEGRWRNTLEAKLSWTDLAYPLLDPAAPWKSARGEALIGGTPQRYTFDLKAALDADGIPAQLEAAGSGNLDAVELARVQLAALNGLMNAQGRVAWAPQLAADVRGTLAGIDPAQLAPEWPGRINGEFSAQGGFAGQSPDIRFSAALKDSRLRDYVLALDAAGRYHDDTLDIDSAVLRSGASTVHARGRALAPFDLSAELDSPDLANLWPGLAGRAQLAATFKGQIAAPQLTAKGSIEQLVYGEYKVETATLDAAVDLKRSSQLSLKAQKISAGAPIESLSVEGSGTAADHRLNLALRAPDGAADLTFAGAWNEARQSWSGRLAEGRLAPAKLDPWTLAEPAALQLSASAAALEPACWTGESGRVCLQGSWSPTAARAAMRLENLGLAYLRPLLPRGYRLEGSIAGTVVAAVAGGQLSELRADLAFGAGKLMVRRETAVEFLPGRVLLEQQGANMIAQVDLPLSIGSIKANAQLGPAAVFMQRPLAGSVELLLPDLSWLGKLTAEVEKAEGRFEARYALAGTLAAPELDGNAELSGGRFLLVTPAIELSEVSARITGGGSGALQVQASAKSGDGTLSLSGSAGPGPLADLQLKGDNFQVANMLEARAWVSPDLNFRLAEGEARVTGTLVVPRAEITPKNLNTGVGPTSDEVIVRTGEEADTKGPSIHAEVRLELGDKVRFEGFGLKTRIEGAVTAYEEPGRPTSARGELRLMEGQYKAYGQDLTIQTGRLIFTGGPVTSPAVELDALRKPTDEIEVGVRVRGTLDSPRLSLYSTPSMPQEQQLGWLVLGRSLEATGNSDDRAMLSNAALALGLSGGDFLAQKLRGGLGIDEVSIGSKPGEDADQAKLTIGKYISPKLYVAYGFGIFQPGQVFRLLYDLGHGFKISTESGVNTGGDVLYSIERK